MRFLRLALVLLFVLPPLVSHAQALSCRKGGIQEQADYLTAYALIQRGTRLSEAEELVVLHGLEVGRDNQCQQAAMVFLTEIVGREVIALPEDASKQRHDALTETFHSLLLEAASIGEGQFQLGNFYLTERGKYALPKEGARLIEAAANAGDGNAIRFLAQAYREGANGFKPDAKAAGDWQLRSERLPPEDAARTIVPGDPGSCGSHYLVSKLRQAVSLAKQLFQQRDYQRAIDFMDANIALIGDDYLVQYADDDSSNKLMLSGFEQKSGRLSVAAALKRSVLKSRQEMYEVAKGCSS